MKRSNVTRSKEQALARKRALIRQLIEQSALTGDASPVTPHHDRRSNIEYLYETPDTAAVGRRPSLSEPCQIIPFPKFRADRG